MLKTERYDQVERGKRHFLDMIYENDKFMFHIDTGDALVQTRDRARKNKKDWANITLSPLSIP